MAKEMDAGDIILQENYNLNEKETAGSLAKVASERAGVLLHQAIQLILSHPEGYGAVQNSTKATYCSFLTKEDSLLHFDQPAAVLERRVRALSPHPLAYTTWQGKKMMIGEAVVLEKIENIKSTGKVVDYDKKNGVLVQTGHGLLGLQQIQIAGKRMLSHQDFINGHRSILGSDLGKE